MNKKWCVVHTKPKHENIAYRELVKQGFNCYSPIYQESVLDKRLRKYRNKIFSMFPSYLFVEIDPEVEKWRCINGTIGVNLLVGCSEEHFSFLPDGWIEDLKQKLEDNPSLETLVEKVKYTRKSEFQIKDGSFEGHIGTYVKSSKNRIFLLLSLLGTEITTELSLDSVQYLRG